MSDDFKALIDDIRAEAKEEGPDAEAEIRELQREFSMASELLALRRAQKMSQRELAAASGIPQSEISRIEGGSANPTHVTLTALAAPFGARVGFVRD
jgi:DNA-binding transcriptional regulator YiaG